MWEATPIGTHSYRRFASGLFVLYVLCGRVRVFCQLSCRVGPRCDDGSAADGEAFLGFVRQSGLIEPDRLEAYLEQRFAHGLLPAEPKELATVLIRDGLLTYFQAHELQQGKFRGFNFGKYKVLERLGCGRNSNVFLCEQLTMRRKVVLKILPLAKAENPVALARFDREARAAGALLHPNIVHTYDHGQEKDLHFLVMEYVDDSSLEEVVQKYGPMAIDRAADYMRQAAIGLQHLHQTGLIHRDIKPANILLERRGNRQAPGPGPGTFLRGP